jgi:hypothetical protein
VAGRKAGWATAWQPRPAGKTAYVTRGNARAPTWSPRADRACYDAVARSPVARRWLDGGKVLPVSTGGVPGWLWARRAEAGLTEEVG